MGDDPSSDAMKARDVVLLVEQLPFVKHFGMQITNCEPRQVEVEMPYQMDFSSGQGVFPAAIVGAIGDVAAVASSLSCLPKGWFTATMDFTVKLIKPAVGEKLIARGNVLDLGKTFSVSKSDIYVKNEGQIVHCGTLLATSRNFRMVRD
jgi:uncharacterized protein (TIGR00369 family)